MVESFKLFVRTYVYWVGLILGFAIFPGYLLFTAGVAPVNIPLWLAPLAGLLLFVFDSPSTWDRPRWHALLIRACGTGFATVALVAFDATGATCFGSHHWCETLVSLGLGWIAFIVVAGWVSRDDSSQNDASVHEGKEAVQTFTAWVGICFGVFYIPATVLAASGTLLMVIPLFGTFLTGLVLLIADPPKRWSQTRLFVLWMRLCSSGAAALLLAVAGTVHRDTRTHEVFIGDWQENLIFHMGAWGLYVAVAGVAYLMRNPSLEPYDNLSR